MKSEQYDVVTICNALIDILAPSSDSDLNALSIQKGIMHLVTSHRQQEILAAVRGRELSVELGGSGMNVTRALAYLGMKTSFVGMVGNDEFGLRIRTRMAELGIHSCIQSASEPTGSCVVLVTPDGERTMNTSLGASCVYDASMIPHEVIKTSKVLHVTGYQWSTSQQKQAVEEAIATARNHDTLVSFDAADPGVAKAFGREFRLLIEQRANIIFANAEEARSLWNLEPREAAAKMSRQGKIAVVKVGADGAIIGRDGDLIKSDAVPTAVVDTTAAGDMFAAGFLYGVLTGKSLQECGRIAALLASDVISRVGAVLSPEAIEAARAI